MTTCQNLYVALIVQSRRNKSESFPRAGGTDLVDALLNFCEFKNDPCSPARRRHGHISMRAGLILTRTEYVTLADGNVAFNPVYKAIQYSSVYGNESVGDGHGRGRLDSPQAWSAAQNIPGQWFQVSSTEHSMI